MRLLNRVLPGSLYWGASVLKRHRRSQVIDRKLRDPRFVVDEALIRDVRVVPDRTDILETLPRGAVTAEIGVAKGEFTEDILAICQPSKLYLIDLWGANSGRYANLADGVANRFAGAIASGQVEIRRGYSWDKAAELADANLAFAYIDAAHDYDSVYKDLRAIEPKIAPDGAIGGHDYTRWSGNGLHRWGVVEAVNEFCNERRWRFAMLSNEPGRHISYLLRRA